MGPLAGGKASAVIRARAIIRVRNSSSSQRSCTAAGRDATTWPAIQKLVPLAGSEPSTVIRARALVMASNSSSYQRSCAAAGRNTTTWPAIQRMEPLAEVRLVM
jgi:hypothetical protein